MTTYNMRAPGSLTRVDTSAKHKPGAVWTDESTGKRYRYCYNAGATSWTIGVPIGMFLTADYIYQLSFTAATQLVATDGTEVVTPVAGIGLGTVATTEYGWVQVGGICDYLVTDGNVTASMGLWCDDNGVVALPVTAAARHGIFGFSIDADNASSVCTKSLLTNCVCDY